MKAKPVVRAFVIGDKQGLMSFLDSVLTHLGYEFLPDSKDSDIRDIETAYLGGDGAFFVVATGSEIRGCVGVRRLSDQVAELKRLYLSEKYRGRGLGRDLCTVAIEESKRLGCTVMRLDTTRRATPALGLFQKLGFQEIPRYNDDEFAEIFMEKTIVADADRGQPATCPSRNDLLFFNP